MIRELPMKGRQLKTERVECDLVVVGGGLAGVCCAITAARQGISVSLVQDRPVLGGNASSEIRMVICGASASTANNNRWAREGGVIDEFLVENVFRNPEGNPLISDTILLEMVYREPNLQLFLNTAVFELGKSGDGAIAFVRGFCPQNSTLYELHAPLFCDASGDGIVGYLSGAAFRMGAEPKDEFGEGLAPASEYGELLGHTIYFCSKDAGRPVKFIRPSFAMADITQISRWQRINSTDQGCQYWWLEYGGRQDTIHDTEDIKRHLWEIVYGIWDYIKNSGRFSDTERLTLEWVGTVPGKRESRRFEGDYVLTQGDIIGRRRHADAVSYGGWSLDLHPADGVYSSLAPCNQWHTKGVYQIPYRCFYSRNVGNLFLAGRLISASHVAFGSTRVMATCAHNAQAVGVAAAICRRRGVLPAALTHGELLGQLKLELARTGQYIPGYRLDDPEDLARRARITASSRLQLSELPPDGDAVSLATSRAMLLPVAVGAMPALTFFVDAAESTDLELELRCCSAPDSYTPDVALAKRSVRLRAGENQAVTVGFGVVIDVPRYVFACLMRNEQVRVRTSSVLIAGVTAVVHRGMSEVSAGARQAGSDELGVEEIEFWRAPRRPEGRNLAMRIEPALDVFGPESVSNGFSRPTCGPNAWTADFTDAAPRLSLEWEKPQSIARIELVFDTDRDNPLFSVLYGNPERVLPQCVRKYRVLDADGNELVHCVDNHQTRNTIFLKPAAITSCILLELTDSWCLVPASVVEVRCYAEGRDKS